VPKDDVTAVCATRGVDTVRSLGAVGNVVLTVSEADVG
jgi:uncharacterized protein (DUF1697 family)